MCVWVGCVMCVLQVVWIIETYYTSLVPLYPMIHSSALFSIDLLGTNYRIDL